MALKGKQVVLRDENNEAFFPVSTSEIIKRPNSNNSVEETLKKKMQYKLYNNEEISTELPGIEESVNTLVKEIEDAKGGSESLKSFLDKKVSFDDLDYLSPEMFGVKANGIDDDSEVFKELFEIANKIKKPVKCTGEKYYIKSVGNIPVKVDVDFNGATFFIDDTNVENRKCGVFEVLPDVTPFTFKGQLVTKINKNTRIVPELAGNGLCMVTFYNNNKRQYIRKGALATNGSYQRDSVLINNFGVVLNDIIWDFDEITSVVVNKVSDNYVTIKNGKFETKVNQAELKYNYFERGFRCTRNRVIFENISHTLTNEVGGSPYLGFIHLTECADIIIRDCSLQSHKYFLDADSNTSMGNYDLRYDTVVKVLCQNVIDTGMYKDRWGIHTCNHSKDLIFEKCTLSRVDAHMGVHNISIKDSMLGHQGVRLIGSGTAIIERCSVIDAQEIVGLRGDYGASWDGDMYIKDVDFIARDDMSWKCKIINFSNVGDHDFGYPCYFPNLYIENVTIHDENPTDAAIYLIANGGEQIGLTNINDRPFNYIFKGEISAKNVKVSGGGKAFRVFTQSPIFIYCDKESEFSVGTMNESNYKDLYIKPNFKITLDNVDLEEVPSTSYHTTNLFGYHGSDVNPDTDQWVDNKHRCVMELNYINCTGIAAGVLDTPMILNIDRSIVKLIVGKNVSTRMIGKITNSTISPDVSSTSANVINPNWKSFLFENVLFDSVYVNGEKTTDMNVIKNIYPFLKNLDVIGNRHIYAKCWMKNCTHRDFDFEALDPHIKYCPGFEFGTYNFNYYFSSYGYAGEKPRPEEVPLPVGFVYYVTSSKSTDVWNGSQWLRITTSEIV